MKIEEAKVGMRVVFDSPEFPCNAKYRGCRGTVESVDYGLIHVRIDGLDEPVSAWCPANWKADCRLTPEQIVDATLDAFAKVPVPSGEGCDGREAVREVMQRLKDGPQTLNAKWLDPECWDGCKSLVLKKQVEELRADLRDMQATFDLRWKADQRAIDMWRKKTGKTLMLPDHADLCLWLLGQLIEKDQLLDEAIAVHNAEPRPGAESPAAYKAMRIALDACKHGLADIVHNGNIERERAVHLVRAAEDVLANNQDYIEALTADAGKEAS